MIGVVCALILVALFYQYQLFRLNDAEKQAG